MDSGGLRILFVAGCWYPDEDRPVEGIFIRRHAEAVALRHDVRVLHIAAREDGPEEGELHHHRHEGVEEYHLRFRALPTAAGGGLQTQLAYFRATRAGLKAIGNPPPDILHLHVVPSAAVVLALRLFLPPLPLLLTEHWSGYLPSSGVRLGPARRLYTRYLTRRAAAVTTVSEAHARAMRAAGFDGRYRVIPNVVDPEVFHPPKERPPGPFRFIVVASLRPEKKVPEIVRAFRRALSCGLEAELQIVGDGEKRQEAERAAEGDGRVVFFGELDGNGVAEKIRYCDALILFSAFENSPCVIGEALASGLPVIAPAIGGIPESVGPGQGILVPPGDPDALEEAMISMAGSTHEWDREALRSYAVSTFSPEVIGRMFDEEYRRALGRGL